MRTVRFEDIVINLRNACIKANFELPDDVYQAIKAALDKEQSPIGREILSQLIENADIARTERIPICQDTGTAVVWVELGQDVHVEGGFLIDAINEGVRQGYVEGYLRKSIVADPLRRKNTGDNTPAHVHVELVPGEVFRVTVLPKGGGSENMGRLAMLTPADGVDGVKKFVLDAVEKASANPCPPGIIGVGIGSTFDGVALLAKKALLRPIGERHPDPFYADLELELLELVNSLGIGPQGLGGRITTLDVHIEVAATHITSLPVAVNINCHAARRVSFEI